MPRASAWIAAVALLMGCSTTSVLRREYAQKQLDAIRYPAPLDEVWLEVRRLLAQKGYPMAEEDGSLVGQRPMGFGDRLLSPARATYPYGKEGEGLAQRLGMAGGEKLPQGVTGGLSLDTGWRVSRDRYHVDGFKDDKGSWVVFTLIVTNDDHQDRKTRDVEIELDLARRLAPEQAAKIDEGIEQVGKK